MKGAAVSGLFISFWLIGFAKQVIDTDVVESGNLDEKLNRDSTFAVFIIRIGWL